jgi:transmembrane sensor
MKGSMSLDPDDIVRMEAAADWLVRLDDTPDDAALVAAWLQWCEDDARNLSEFKSAQAVWHAARAIDVRKRSQNLDSVDADLAEPAFGVTKVSAITPTSQPAGSVSVRKRSWFSSIGARVTGMAATVLLIVGIGSAMYLLRSHETSQSYATAVGGTATSDLPDGSRVELGGGSRIATRYTQKLRTVTVEAGEAYFSVAKDPMRPFLVIAGAMRVTAVGTAFNVRRDSARVVVGVSEGRVKLDSGVSPATADDSLRLLAGEQAVYNNASGDVTIAKIRTADVASWRQGMLKYVHEPLGSVVEDLSRYYPKRIVINDATLGQLPFTGTVFSANVVGALRAFEEVFPLQIKERDDSVELVPRAPIE